MGSCSHFYLPPMVVDHYFIICDIISFLSLKFLLSPFESNTQKSVKVKICHFKVSLSFFFEFPMFFRFRPTLLLEGAKSFEVLKASPFQSPSSSRFLHSLRSVTANHSAPVSSFSFAQIPVLLGSEINSA